MHVPVLPPVTIAILSRGRGTIGNDGDGPISPGTFTIYRYPTLTIFFVCSYVYKNVFTRNIYAPQPFFHEMARLSDLIVTAVREYIKRHFNKLHFKPATNLAGFNHYQQK